MPKSKEFIENSDSEDAKNVNKNGSASGEESTRAAASKKSKAKSSDTNENPPAKRVKTNDDAENDTGSATNGPKGDGLYEIGKLRYVSVSQFRGKPYVNIREYYLDDGVEKPGRKGISLGIDQWEKFKELINQVDKDLKNSK